MASLMKNVASQNFTFCLVLASTGAAFVATSTTNIAGNVTKDGGAQTTVSGAFTLLGNGQYNYAPTQAETNATDVGFLLTATGVIPVNIDFHTDLTDATGNLQVDTVRVNNVSTSGVTAIGANVGSSQPINFTGTGGSALVQVDARDINGVAATAVTTINANIGTTQPTNFTGTGASAFVQADVKDWNSGGVGSLPANFSLLAIDGSGNVSTTSNVKKNAASAGFSFVMTAASNNSPMTGLTVTGTRSIDGGAFASTTNSPFEIANGWYAVNLSATDTNGNHIALRFAATNANDTDVEIVTQP